MLHLALLHRLEEGGLHLGGGAVDLVGEDDVGEDRALAGVELAVLGVVDLRAGDVGGQEVGRELDAHEAGADAVGQGVHGERLGQAGDALDEDVAVAEKRDEEAVDEVALADDDLADLGSHGLDELRMSLHTPVDVVRIDGHATSALVCAFRVYTSGTSPPRSPSPSTERGGGKGKVGKREVGRARPPPDAPRTYTDVVRLIPLTSPKGIRMPDFASFGLHPLLIRSLKEMGFEEPTPVQEKAVPLLLEGRDVVAQALTGTGKTAAYGIPLMMMVNTRLNRPQAIIMAPTRELAVQVAEHLSQLGRHLKVSVLPIYGGQPYDRQLRALSRGTHVVVATPGRLMDHMRRGTLALDSVRLLVLDEADQMLQMGFQEDVEFVISHLPPERVTALFSATMPQPILDIVHNYMRNPEIIRLSQPRALTLPEVEQVYYQVPFPRKFDVLCRILDAHPFERSIVFCATKRMVDEVAERLPGRGYAASALHGDVTQAGRERVLKAFREGRSELLIATDVAARGLDVPEVSLVINFDIPPDPEYYVHRIGRTGRFGRGGKAITFVNPREMRELQVIERVTGARILRGDLPTPAEAEERELQVLEDRLLDALEGGEWRRFRPMLEELLNDHPAEEIAAAALQLAAQGKVAVRRVASGRAHGPPRRSAASPAAAGARSTRARLPAGAPRACAAHWRAATPPQARGPAEAGAQAATRQDAAPPLS